MLSSYDTAHDDRYPPLTSVPSSTLLVKSPTAVAVDDTESSFVIFMYHDPHHLIASKMQKSFHDKFSDEIQIRYFFNVPDLTTLTQKLILIL
jgi:hypothetical protein